jgi:multimeric flavodoxin WrbA
MWLDSWDYLHDHLSNKVGGVFATGGHLYGGIENTLNSLQSYFQIFGMQVWVGEQDFQPSFLLGVAATTGDVPFNSSIPGHVDDIFLNAGTLYGARLAKMLVKRAAGHEL